MGISLQGSSILPEAGGVMNEIYVLLKGALAGLIISAPVGPVNVLCTSRALAKGRKAGAVSGIGAATADTIYGAAAGFSVQFVVGFLTREEFWIRLFGGLLLIAIGARYYLRSPRQLKDVEKEESSHSDFVTAFLLNLANPTTVLSFLAVLTALGLHQHRSFGRSITLVAGIFMGAMLWWICLAVIASRFRDRLDDHALMLMNRVAGVAIGGFGLATAALSLIENSSLVTRLTQAGFN
jgi:threonine/homoserine/homoserine lactone efflux protein